MTGQEQVLAVENIRGRLAESKQVGIQQHVVQASEHLDSELSLNRTHSTTSSQYSSPCWK